jgi:primosomal protein N' (replication factor Y)
VGADRPRRGPAVRRGLLSEAPPPLDGLPAPARVRKAAGAAARRPRKPVEDVAEQDPVARVLVTVALPHLDRPFDYLVPASMATAAQPGTLVRVPFAGSDVEGFVLERLAASEHPGRLVRLRRVVSDVEVLTPQVLEPTSSASPSPAGTRPRRRPS